MHRIILLFTLLVFCYSCDKREISQATRIDREGLNQILTTDSDKVQVINFWATWCAPCVEELPAFEELGNDYLDDVQVTLISLDEVDALQEKVNPFLTSHQIKSKVVLLDDPYAAEWIPMVDAHWDGAIPVTLIKNKNKQRFFNQTFTHEELQKAVKEFL